MKTGHLPFVAAAGLLCTGVFLSPQAKASDWDRLTKITINQPFEIPGMVLPPGTYTMRLLDEPFRSPDVVVFADENDQKVFEIVEAIPTYRVNAVDHTVLTFAERLGNSPQAIKSWWYPGSLRGEEFLYPKTKGVITASAAVVAPAAPVAAAPAQFAPRSEEAQAAPAQQATTPQPVEIAQVQPPASDQQAPAAPSALPENNQSDTNQAPQELSGTGSDFPLFGLLGIVSAGSGLALRFRSI